MLLPHLLLSVCTALCAAQEGFLSGVGSDGQNSIEVGISFQIDLSTSITTTTASWSDSHISNAITTSILHQTQSTSLDSGPSILPTTATTTGEVPKATFTIDVGAFPDPWANRTLFEFRPNNVTASFGDVVIFNMLGLAHSVTQSSFFNPCQSIGAIDTDLQPNLYNQSQTILKAFSIITTDPLWFYCKQKNHCQEGMVFAINPGSDDKMNAFIDNAKASNATLSNSTTNSSSIAQMPNGTGIFPCGGSMALSTGLSTGLPCALPTAMPGAGWNGSTSAVYHTPIAPTTSPSAILLSPSSFPASQTTAGNTSKASHRLSTASLRIYYIALLFLHLGRHRQM